MRHVGEIQIRWLGVNALLEKEREKREHAPILRHRYHYICIYQPDYIIKLLAPSPLTQFSRGQCPHMTRPRSLSGNKSETSAFTGFRHFLPCLMLVFIIIVFVTNNYRCRILKTIEMIFSYVVYCNTRIFVCNWLVSHFSVKSDHLNWKWNNNSNDERVMRN